MDHWEYALIPHDLNKAIISEHYEATIFEEFYTDYQEQTIFSKMDCKDGFWSIH